MVNPGHPSKGCRTCKLRKIQCDLARPACRYCTKSGRVCLGYEERQIIHSTGWQSISSCPSNIPGDNDTPWNIESWIASISLLKDLLVGTGERNPQERYSFKAMNTKGTNNVAISAISTIRKCLHSLRQTEQSFPNRRALLAEYSTTTSELRATLAVSPYSPALASAAFLFSIYEVCSCFGLSQPILIIDSDDGQHRPKRPNMAYPSPWSPEYLVATSYPSSRLAY